MESGSPWSSAALLEELEHANLFILPLDQEQRWYRYHTLFAELLQGYLHRSHAGQVPALHARASLWFEQQGLIADAIHHALAGGEWERATRLVSANVFALLEQRELNTLSRKLDSLDSTKSFTQPWLWIGRAWLAAYTGELNSVETFLQTAETMISSSIRPEDPHTLRAHCAAIRAFSAWLSGRRDLASSAAQEALAGLPETDSITRCQAATVLGMTLDDMDARSRAFEMALDYAGKCGTSHVCSWLLGVYAHSARQVAPGVRRQPGIHPAGPGKSYLPAASQSALCKHEHRSVGVE
jgi:LuxR family maltose regulon positive regulatory protein